MVKQMKEEMYFITGNWIPNHCIFTFGYFETSCLFIVVRFRNSQVSFDTLVDQ